METWPDQRGPVRSIKHHQPPFAVYANLEGSSIQLELREESLQASALVVFVDDLVARTSSPKRAASASTTVRSGH